VAGGWDGFTSQLSTYINDPAARRESGRTIASRLALDHSGIGWQRRLEDVYRQALETPRPRPEALGSPPPKVDEIDLSLPGHVPVEVPYALLRGLPQPMRLRARNDLRRNGFPIGAGEIVRTVIPTKARIVLRRMYPRPS
jgi:hypothetical protein